MINEDPVTLTVGQIQLHFFDASVKQNSHVTSFKAKNKSEITWYGNQHVGQRMRDSNSQSAVFRIFLSRMSFPRLTVRITHLLSRKLISVPCDFILSVKRQHKMASYRIPLVKVET